MDINGCYVLRCDEVLTIDGRRARLAGTSCEVQVQAVSVESSAPWTGCQGGRQSSKR